MPATNPWGKKAQQKVPHSFASPNANGDREIATAPASLSPRSLYDEIQQDELFALASIYGDDFKRIESTAGAWKKSYPRFEIRIKSSDEDLAITLCVTFTATYPKSPPLLSVKADDSLRDGTKFKIHKVIETRPKELAVDEQAMIMEIVNSCLDVLEDAAQAKAAGQELPSLEEERAAHEAAVSRRLEDEKQQEAKRKELEILEEERMQETLLQEELKRQKAKAKEAKRKNQAPSTLASPTSFDAVLCGQAHHESLTFEQPIELLNSAGDSVLFQVVGSKVCIRRGPASYCFTVRPLVPLGSGDVPSLLLKQTDLGTQVKDNLSKTQLQLLESELKILKEARHPNLLEILDFKVHRTLTDTGESDSAWTVSILTELAEKGSLSEFLDIAGSLGVEKVRAWTIELLDALQFLHARGIVHGDIHAGNVLLVRASSGEVKPKLADAGYQRKLQNLRGRSGPTDTISVAKSAYWVAPEIAHTNQPQNTQKTDVWDFGIVFLQMLFGLAVVEQYSSPIALADSLNLSLSLNEFVLKMFKADSKKRPRAVELSPSEFLATNAMVLDNESSAVPSRYGSMSPIRPTTSGKKLRRESFNAAGMFPKSRYREDFVEEGRLGKGGFGEVVKARKRLDGQIYAIKKITQRSSATLTEILKEVRLLSQLSHPCVVRYYNTWTEDVFDDDEMNEDNSAKETLTGQESVSAFSPGTLPEVEFGASTGGLDFMSSSGYPQVAFGYDDDTDEEDHRNEEDDDDESSAVSNGSDTDEGEDEHSKLELKRTRSDSRHHRSGKTMLYISMEYCEKQTLRDLIKRGLSKEDEEIWRLFRQILEGLAHIHGLGVVHRDLKPENIFIDAASNVKIGDFGLATSGQYTIVDRSTATQSHMSGDMTRSIGTAFYIANEVKSSVGGTYTSKVDMYSLGMIFFEMCFRPLIPGMDRAIVGEALRSNVPTLPAEFDTSDRPVQADIILVLLNHNPKERPSASELLKSGRLPLQMESETIRQALTGLTDSKSPYYEKMMEALFALDNDRAKDSAWDIGSDSHDPSALLLQGIAKQKLTSIFRNHGAIELPRTILFPRSGHYGANAVQLLDERGIKLQLPFDLTLPHARDIAKHETVVQRSFAFGQVFRDRASGGQPVSFGEVDFDIVSTDTLDLALKEAEAIKVLDEIIANFPSLASAQMCFHINHFDLLDLIFDFCRIETSIRPAVAETLSKLNVHTWSWAKIRAELRSPLIGVSAPSLDDLQKFDFRDTPNKAIQRLKTLFQDSDTFERSSSSIAHIRDVIDFTKRFDVGSKIYLTPLSSFNAKFYRHGLIFACLFDRKIKDVFAAGGRYDSLIREHRLKTGNHHAERHAVGFNLAWEKLARLPKTTGKAFLKKPEEESRGIWVTKRCDVLVASHDPTVLRNIGIEIIRTLWANSISAELARDSRSPEDLLSKYREDNHSWIIIIKQDSVLKIKSMDRKEKEDVDIPSTQLLSFLRAEIRERDQKSGLQVPQRSKLQRGSSTGDMGPDHEQDVRVVVAGTKSKKSNRRNIVEQAQSRAAILTREFLDGPIAAIETTDQVIELIRGTRLSDAESWRAVLHAVPTAERKYLGEVHEMLESLKAQNADITRNAFVYNFRTGKCIYYDLGA